jgi:hypothetical protein
MINHTDQAAISEQPLNSSISIDNTPMKNFMQWRNPAQLQSR